MSPPGLGPFWRVLEHIKAEYAHAKGMVVGLGYIEDGGRTPPPGQWCLEYCTARARGAEMGYVDESCLCGYEKDALKREVAGRRVGKSALGKRQSFASNGWDEQDEFGMKDVACESYCDRVY
ncbi:Hypothetical predicted protein [Lecanosticta acicola]|uniref:Uncharacterized protein n=1 Tax=Lecanosticta acicola TaxID=111012 RepID=A0AAI9E8V7_9PEZI|nr:Hypothetical predicted protein [Lecanosticta acicola]